jgi:hypothetical protein
MKSGFRLLLSILLNIFLSSCFATQNFSKNTKTIQSYTTDNIIIDPFISAKKEIYLTLTNSTIYEKLDLENSLKYAFKKRGFEVLQSPQNAPLILDVKIRYYGIFEKEILNSMLEDKTKKDAISGEKNFEDFNLLSKPTINVDFSNLAIGGVGGFLIFKTILGAFGSAILTSGIAIILENSFEQKTLLAMLDVNIYEVSKEKIKTFDFRQIKLGEGGYRKIEFADETNYKSYQTKVIIILKRKFITEKNGIEDASKQIIASISGII